MVPSHPNPNPNPNPDPDPNPNQVWDVEQKRIGFAKAVLEPPERDMHLWQEKGPVVHAGVRLQHEP